MIWNINTELGSLTLREQIEPEDESDIIALFRACDDWFEAATGGPSAPGDVQSLFYSLPEGANMNDKRLFTLRDDGDIIGLVDAVLHYPSPQSCAIGTFLIAPSYRRHRAGTLAAHLLLDEARSAGLDHITATVPDGWRPGIEFLKSLGFEIGDIQPRSTNRRIHDHEPPVRRATLTLASPGT
ncbi:GNAT family N-acetyltransferase [Phytoactinopolyspora halophila]|nr:GNAT family N-acetyltransferase [Phytoactinopolyspora halophila]